MRGQWTGSILGTNDKGFAEDLVVNIDEDRAEETWFQVCDRFLPFSAHARFSISAIEAFQGKGYNLQNPWEYGIILNMAQHHGFPTPLLDWTKSPFVAAFFAFAKKRTESDSSREAVRIFEFDTKEWPESRVHRIDHIGLCFARLILGARDNPRAMPQQSVNIFSNVVNIEGFIEHWQSCHGKKVISRIDIPYSDRQIAMQELRTMGITRASLFPGLDGICGSFADMF